MSTATTVGRTPERPARPLWRRLIGFNLLSAVVLGVGGYYLGWWIGHLITDTKSYEYTEAVDENDVALLLAYLFGVIDELAAQGHWDGWIGCEYRPRGGTSEGLGWARGLL